MKLIQILGLVTAMAVSAAAQNTGTNSQSAGSPAPPKSAANQGQQPKSAATPASDKNKKKKTGAAGAHKQAGGSTQSGTVKLKTPETSKSGAIKVSPGTPASGSKASPASKGAAAAQTGKSSTGQPAKGAGSAASKTVAPVKTGGAPSTGVQSKTGTKADTKTGTQSKTGVVAGGATKTKKSPFAAAPPTPRSGKKAAGSAAATKKKSTGTSTADKKKSTKPAEKKPIVAGKTGGPAGQKTFRAGGTRDPFVSPIRATVSGPQGPTHCETGKRCLFIPELVVQGTVRDLNGKMVAIVVNRARHTYFLRESDQVFNGSVQRITTDSVVFRQYMTDNLGRESAHEVVKRVGGGPST